MHRRPKQADPRQRALDAAYDAMCHSAYLRYSHQASTPHRPDSEAAVFEGTTTLVSTRQWITAPAKNLL